MMDDTNVTMEARMDPRAMPNAGPVKLIRIKDLADNLSLLVDQIKATAFLPSGAKVAPVFNLVQLAALCHLTTDSLSRRLAKADESGLPIGTYSVAHKTALDSTDAAESSNDNSKRGATTFKPETAAEPKGRRIWTLAEAHQWVRACGIPYKRPPGVPGNVITVANFKGGVSKTITALSLAQGLSLMGYKVLAIDVDPQGSLTSLFGLLPTDIDDEMTIIPIMDAKKLPDGSINPDARSTISESIVSTYWGDLDLVAGSRSLFNAEFFLPMRQMASTTKNAPNAEPGFEFFSVLKNALDGVRHEYDYIIIDTPPALSYITINALWAADSMLMPLPPEGLDIVSSSQFWNMYHELISRISQEKSFQFVAVLPSKVDHAKVHTKTLLKWMSAGFKDLLLPVEIPSTQVVSHGTTELRTVFDITKYSGATKTYARAREAFDKLVAEIDHLTRHTCWGQPVKMSNEDQS